VVEKAASPRVLKDEDDLPGIQQQIDRHHHRARLDDPEIGGDEGLGVDTVEGDPIPQAHLMRCQPGGHRIRIPIQLGEADRVIREQDHGLITPGLRDAAKLLRNARHGPIPGGR
jgi:hypothetical protein